MSAIRFGAWGLGRIGTVHAKHFSAQAAMYDLVAGCDCEPPKVARLVAEYHCAGYTRPEEFLADPEVELVVIATRSLDHTAHALQALAAGKYVLLEKPIAMNSGDICKLREADREYTGKLFFLHNHRFEPAFQHMLKIIRTGILGSIEQVKICRHHRYRRRPDWQAILRYGGGQLNNWGSHVIDHALQFIGAPVKDVWSNLKGINAVGDAENHVKIIITGENGIVVDLEISDAVALPGAFCTVYGNRGSLICPDEKQIHLRYIEPGFEFPDVAASPDSPPLTGGFGHEEEIPWRQETIAVEPAVNMWEYVEVATAQHLYKALREGVPFPVANADALEVARIIGLVKDQNAQFKWDFWVA
ncbi:MAG: Gfo/Idh/MocA family oxidoreductase [Planctomycetes bacterium]|nr:Gfo/Idh/MocA family oxidoreductase [Planctomycetota bacterium]